MALPAGELYLPSEGTEALENLAFDLAREASELSGQFHPVVRLSVADLVRSVNGYYSSLIERCEVHPGAIDRALAADYSDDPCCSDLQREVRAHIEVQHMIDGGSGFPKPPATRAFIEWLHREFCARLPTSLLIAENADTGERLPIIPGELRKREVTGGQPNPPSVEELPDCMARFEQAYDSVRLTKPRQAVAAAAAHQRLLWIHPFLDGNGRIAQLMSHAMLLDVGVGATLWSISRGLARNSEEYRHLLTQAGVAYGADRDGRCAASQRPVVEFCRFFLTSCIDQVRYMRDLFRPTEVLRRIELYVQDEESANRLPKRSFGVLREAFLYGELERGRVPGLFDASERTARRVISALVEKRLLVSESHRAPLRLAFPIDVVERWFPLLYPLDASRQ